MPIETGLTVFIPTHRRPDMLRSTLASVADQSAVDRITRVIVSENSDDPRSREVCAEFSSLPIDYVMRSPALEPGRHFCQIVSEVRTDLVAMVADDDMWSRNHIAEALRHLEMHPSAVGYFGQIAVVGNESRFITASFGPTIQALILPRGPRFSSAEVWGAKEVLLESLLRTPLTMWALVGRTSAVRQSSAFLTESLGGADSDRYFAWKMACAGDLVVGAEVSLFMRSHGGNACARMHAEAAEFHRRKAYEYSKSMIAEAEGLGIDWRSGWMDWWSRLSPSEREYVWGLRIPGARDALREALGAGFNPPDVRLDGSPLRRLLPWVPPALLPALRRLADVASLGVRR